MIVNPASGALVRDPVTNSIITDRTEVDLNDPYWARLFADGDIGPNTPTAPAVATRQSAPSTEDAA